MEKDKIKRALAYAGINQTKAAEALGYSQANFAMKMKRESLTDQEKEKLAETMGATYKCYFEFEDGTKI